MEIDPKDVLETTQKTGLRKRRQTRSLNVFVAVTIALISTFMGICRVKDDNIVQAMQQAQADKLDQWAFYQARNLRQETAQSTLIQLQLSRSGVIGPRSADYDRAIAHYEGLIKDQAEKKEALRLQALQSQKNYEALNFIDDQFDLADASLAIAVALLAVTALTNVWFLYWVSMVPTALGVLMGLSGLFAWGLHPDVLIRWLS